MKKIKILSSIVLTTILATSAVLAWTDLWIVSDSDTLTSTLWNSVVWKINENGNKLEPITNVWGNVWIWIPSPSVKLDVNWSIKANLVNSMKSYIKYGNNWTASCDTFCQNISNLWWTDHWSCVWNKALDNSRFFSCSDIAEVDVVCLCTSF